MSDDNKKYVEQYMKEIFDPEKPYVFISYSHEKESASKVYSLLKELMKEGINFAIDTEYAGYDGNWLNKMFERIKSVQCHCMMSFYCEDYICSRPSLVEQFLRYSSIVKKNNGNEPLRNIYISLFEDHQIKSHLTPLSPVEKQKKQKELADRKIRSIKRKNADWTEEQCREQAVNSYAFSEGNAIYKYLQLGVFGMYETDLEREECMEVLASFDHLVDIRDYFFDIGIKDGEKWSNANYYDETEHIVSMLKNNGVASDQEIRNQSINMLEGEEEPEVETKPAEVKPVKTKQVESKPVEVTCPKTDLETPLESQSTSDTKKIWHYSGKDAQAKLEWDGESKTCKVLANSKLATEAAGFAKLASAKKLKESLMEQKIIVDGYFVKDYECDKISTMINVINGGSVSMPAEMKNGNLVSILETDVVSGNVVPATDSVPEQKDSEQGCMAANDFFEITLGEFVKRYDDAHFKKRSFDKVALKVEEYDRYSVDAQSGTSELVWKFMMALIRDRGMEVIQHINENCGGKNPVFIASAQSAQSKLSYKTVDIYPDWAMCTNFSQYGWLGRLKKWSEIIGLDSGKMQLVFSGFQEEKASVSEEDVALGDRDSALAGKDAPLGDRDSALAGKGAASDNKDIAMDDMEEELTSSPLKI